MGKQDGTGSPWILGLDVGSGSVGWAAIEARIDGGRLVPAALRGAGSRIFDAGMENLSADGRGE